jgi:tetratricopeptide (TPR) repeat protein
MVNALFDEYPIREETILFGAEFYYDYRNFRRSAELFSAFTDSRSLARQADALWLAGFNDGARGLWRIAAADTSDTISNRIKGDIDLPSIKARSFYNLASTTADRQEAGRYLEQLFAANAEYQEGRIFGIIRYSRLLPADRALAILTQTENEKEGLFDLELLRRRSEDWDINKSVVETWMMLNRHTSDGRLFEWAAWYFDFQHRYEETALALRNAGINRVEGPWSALHRAFALVREHQYGEAEKSLRSIVRSPQETKNAPGRRTQPLWQAAANLAILLEKQKNFQESLQYYEIAAAQINTLISRPVVENGFSAETPAAEVQGIPAAGVSLERRDASKIQLHIASVLRSLGKTPESVRALDYALDFDPENLEARLEKRRLDAERGYL